MEDSDNKMVIVRFFIRTVDHCIQICEIDITYVQMKLGFMYLMVVIDVYSRIVLNWEIPNTLDAQWCKEVMAEALVNTESRRLSIQIKALILLEKSLFFV